MELRQLRYLVAVAEEGSFTRAAAREQVAQPALSQQIRRLEDELQVTLFDRTTRRVRITPAGAALTQRARRALAELDDARADLAEIARVSVGTVSIGVTETPGPFDIHALLVDFHAAHAGVTLSVREDITVELVQALRQDEIDLAVLTHSTQVDYRGLEVVPVVSEPLVAVVSGAHRLAARKRVALRDLRDEAFIVFSPGATIRTEVESAALAHGFRPRVTCETREAARARSMAQAGLGIAVLPRSEATVAADGLHVLALQQPTLTHTVCVAWRATRRLSPAASAMREHALRRNPAPA